MAGPQRGLQFYKRNTIVDSILKFGLHICTNSVKLNSKLDNSGNLKPSLLFHRHRLVVIFRSQLVSLFSFKVLTKLITRLTFIFIEVLYHSKAYLNRDITFLQVILLHKFDVTSFDKHHIHDSRPSPRKARFHFHIY